MRDLPERIADESALDELLSQPGQRVTELMSRLDGDILILGVGGKVGLSVARTALRACAEAGVSKRIVGVDLFPDPSSRAAAAAVGLETITCDLLDIDAVRRLPRLTNVIYMAGRKFGTGGNEALTWAINVLAPGHVAQVFTSSRIVAYSTGCVYPLVEEAGGGCREEQAPAPVGEYAQSCLGRERAFEFYSAREGTPVCLFRLNYAVDLRYGVLYDIGERILKGEPVPVSVGVFNVLWQGDVADRTLLALEQCASPAAPLNVTGTEMLHTREVALRMAEIMGREVSFSGCEGDRNYLSNASKAAGLWGPPTVAAEKLIAWQARWIADGGRSLHIATHFEVSDGKY